ncbi:hypothetical protein JCGZ_14654 [Jatropha curcas]|uniref:PGG domain-containing protein n=1 Tax=Jatropha curcas TaxID=180498 RepID=A0A067K1G7_JATCU|nr:ankyrin repeat-containing protein BDA1 [Jatropha curcas]KDP28883.1 hypothetical protein JCGZ_14654 [Jatropha curcas]
METTLSNAIASGDLTAFQSLVSEDPLALDRISFNSAENPLHMSALSGQTEIAREIVSRKPKFAWELNQDGFSPLHIASANGRLELVRLLLRVGYDLCLLKGKDGNIPLHCAVMKGRADVVKELILACPDSIKQVTAYGETALHIGVKSNQIRVFKALMEEVKKLDMMEIVNWKDKDGNTLLHLATFRKQDEIIELLIGQEATVFGVDLNAINTNGFTPKDVIDFILQIGAQYSDIRILEMFQQAKAMKAQEITRRYSNANDVNREPKLLAVATPSWNLWKELMKEIGESSNETQNALMVVAVLIATVTYQAILSPPSGFYSAESRRSPTINNIQRRTILPGEALMATDPQVFALFTVFNAIGFFASLAMISLLTSGFPLRAGLRLAILSMTATYVIAVVYMAPTEMKTVNIVVWLMGLLVVGEFARFLIWLLKKCGVLPLKKFTTACFAVRNQT